MKTHELSEALAERDDANGNYGENLKFNRSEALQINPPAQRSADSERRLVLLKKFEFSHSGGPTV